MYPRWRLRGVWLRAIAISSTAAACIAAALPLAGCGAAAAGDSSAAQVGVTERDFHISTTTARVAAGDVMLRVQNRGPDQHELIVVPEGASGVPLRRDGLTVDEDAIQSSEPGALEPAAAGAIRYLRLRLAPGRYLLFCNMEGHFLGGMRAELVVGS